MFTPEMSKSVKLNITFYGALNTTNKNNNKVKLLCKQSNTVSEMCNSAG